MIMFAPKKWLYIVAMGIGLGFGLSLVVLQQPEFINADQENVAVSQSLPSQKIYLKNKELAVTNSQSLSLLSNWQKSAAIQWQDQLVLVIKDVPELFLGEEIKILGQNNGLYTWRVIEIKEIYSKDYLRILEENQNKLILFQQSNFIGSKIKAVIAK